MREEDNNCEENKMTHFMQAMLTGADTVAWYTAII